MRLSDEELSTMERDYAFSDYAFFGQEHGERLIEVVKAQRAEIRTLQSVIETLGKANTELLVEAGYIA
jgi:phage tail tape-measure protein